MATIKRRRVETRIAKLTLTFLMFLQLESCKNFELVGKYVVEYGYHGNRKYLAFKDNGIFYDSTRAISGFRMGQGQYEITKDQLKLIYQGEFDNSTFEITKNMPLQDSTIIEFKDVKRDYKNISASILLILDQSYNVIADTVFKKNVSLKWHNSELPEKAEDINLGYGERYFFINIPFKPLISRHSIIEYDLQPLNRDWFAFQPQVVKYDLLKKDKDYLLVRDRNGTKFRFEKVNDN